MGIAFAASKHNKERNSQHRALYIMSGLAMQRANLGQNPAFRFSPAENHEQKLATTRRRQGSVGAAVSYLPFGYVRPGSVTS